MFVMANLNCEKLVILPPLNTQLLFRYFIPSPVEGKKKDLPVLELPFEKIEHR